MTRTRRTLLLLATFGVLLTGVLAGAWSAIPGDLPAAAADQLPAPAVAIAIPAPVLDGVDAAFVAQLLPASEVTDARALELASAGHRVCEGFTAAVPMVDLADSLATGLGFTDREARAFITLAGEFYCPAAA